MPDSGRRWTIDRTEDGAVRVTVRPRRRPVRALVAALRLAIPFAISCMLLGTSAATISTGGAAAIVCCLIPLAFAGVLAFVLPAEARALAWHVSGREEVAIGPTAISVRRRAWLVDRRGAIPTRGTARLTAPGESWPLFRRGLRRDIPDFDRGPLSFECAGASIRWGLGLDDAEAQAICDELAAALRAISAGPPAVQ